MEILIGLVSGFLGGLAARWLFRRDPAPVVHAPNVVKKLGPSVYATQSKRKPKYKTEAERWKEEQGQNI
jgi:hypothetical protein